MSGCCDPSGYRRFFNSREARRAARTFEKRGLEGTAQAMVDAIDRRLPGARVLEGGAGTGGAHVEMLTRGAASAVAVDISDAYLPAAEAIAEGRGVGDRIERRTGDFVALRDELSRADVVFLNRVVCCYPDMPALLDAAADRTDGVLALSYPRDRWFVRAAIAVLNRYLRWRSVGFQVYVHDPGEITAHLEGAGLRPADRGRSVAWHWQVWERRPA